MGAVKPWDGEHKLSGEWKKLRVGTRAVEVKELGRAQKCLTLKTGGQRTGNKNGSSGYPIFRVTDADLLPQGSLWGSSPSPLSPEC